MTTELRGSPILDLSKKMLEAGGNIDKVCDELEERQKYLVKYLDCKKQENLAAKQQMNLQMSELIKRIERVTANIVSNDAYLSDCCEKIVGCTDALQQLDTQKRSVIRAIGELERVEVLKKAVGLLEQSLFDPKWFGEAASSVVIVRDLAENLMECAQAKVWIDKSRKTVPEVLRAADEYLRVCLSRASSIDVAAACRVIETDGAQLERTIEWIAKFYLADYEAAYFQSTDPELRRLGSIDSRLSWLKRVLEKADRSRVPKGWAADTAILDRFANLTRRAISDAIPRETPKTLLPALKASIRSVVSFETYLKSSRSYENFFLMPAFQPHLQVFIDVREAELAHLAAALFQELAQKSKAALAIPHDERFISLSAEQLFQVFKAGLAEVSSMTTGAVVGGLAEVYTNALHEHTRYLVSLSNRLCQAKKCEGVVVESLCIVINTADYIMDAVGAMQESFRGALEGVSRAKVDFSANIEPLSQLLHKAIGDLAAVLMLNLDGGWDELRHSGIGKLADCRDQSPYVAKLQDGVASPAWAQARRLLLPDRHRHVGEVFLALFRARFEGAVYKCRPIGTVGAEQLSYDLQSLKQTLAPLDASDAYRRHLDAALLPLEQLFKILHVDPAGPDDFVANYYLMTDGDCREEAFKRVLEMKMQRDSLSAIAGTMAGREKYLDAFRRHQPPPPSGPDRVSKRWTLF